MVRRYIPEKGDFIYLNFTPQSGHEQRGQRSSLVVSNDVFNQKTGFVVACPITNTYREYPFRIPIPEEAKIAGFVIADRMESLDYRARHATYIEKAPLEILNEALALIDAILF